MNWLERARSFNASLVNFGGSFWNFIKYFFKLNLENSQKNKFKKAMKKFQRNRNFPPKISILRLTLTPSHVQSHVNSFQHCKVNHSQDYLIASTRINFRGYKLSFVFISLAINFYHFSHSL